MNKNQDQELEQGKGKNSSCNPLHQEPMDPVSEKVSDARLSQIFGEALSMSLRRKKRWRLGKLSRRSIFLLRRNHYRRQKMNCLRKR